MSSGTLAIRGARKAFGATVALGGVDLEAERGQVHAVLGENGAGKSTLMNVLSGVVTLDAGAISLAGAPYAPQTPRDARAAGVAMVHQELSLCPHLTVAENILLGREPGRMGFIRGDAVRASAAEAMRAVAGVDRARTLAIDEPVSTLSLADRQLVEIARALADEKCRVLILDEPTSSLGREEVRVLFDRVRAIRDRGLLVLYISHFLDEVKEIADRFTVLRDGEDVGTGDLRDVGVADLVQMMTGRAATAEGPLAPRAPGEVVVSCEDVAGVSRPTRASFELRRGEVLGIAGLVGAGRTELLRVLFGLDSLASGSIRVLGRAGAAKPRDRIAQGLGMVSEDRKGEGLAVGMSVADNLTLSKLARLVRPSWQRDVAARWARRLRIRCRDVGEPVLGLSGGNQQKVAIGRLLHQDAQVLLLDQPTRGIDVGAKAEVHAVIRDLSGEGKAVLVVSDDLPELLSTCDRIAVMRRGVLGVPRPASEWTEATLLSAAIGAGSHAAGVGKGDPS